MSRSLLEESEEIRMNDAHSAVRITLIHHAGDVDLARSCSQSVVLETNEAVDTILID